MLNDHITNGLGSEYRPFVRNLLNHVDMVSFDDLYGTLLSEEMQLKREDKSFAKDNDSLNVSENYSQRTHNRGGQSGRGRGRGQMSSSGHGSPNINYNI